MTGLVEAARFNARVEADLAGLYLKEEGIGAIFFDAKIQVAGDPLP